MRRVHFTDMTDIADWYKAREMPVPATDMPNIGYIIDGLAAGFLIQTDCGVAFLDGFISNPTSDPNERDLALDEITGELLREAEELGYQEIAAFTRNHSIEKRARRWGLTSKGAYTLYVKENQ